MISIHPYNEKTKNEKTMRCDACGGGRIPDVADVALHLTVGTHTTIIKLCAPHKERLRQLLNEEAQNNG